MVKRWLHWLWRLGMRMKLSSQGIYIAPGTYFSRGVKIGAYTRINAASHLGACQIGAYCAIGGRLVVRSSDHHVNYLNMQDWAQVNIIGSDVPVAGKYKGPVVIGNGVWVGDSVVILPGVTIGDGAVVGAGSIVTKSIPAYAIAVGNPAKVIKYRFSQDVIAELLPLKWWEWSSSKLRENRNLFEVDLATISAEQLRTILEDIR